MGREMANCHYAMIVAEADQRDAIAPARYHGRSSLGRDTTSEDIDYTLEELVKVVKTSG